MRRWMLIVLCMLALPCVASPGPAERAEAFLMAIGHGESDKAFDDLFAGSGITDRRPEQVETLRSQARAALELYGKPIGFEKVREENLSRSLKRLVYVQKFARYPMVWEFYFYRATTDWAVNQIAFNDQVGGLVGAKQ